MSITYHKHLVLFKLKNRMFLMNFSLFLCTFQRITYILISEYNKYLLCIFQINFTYRFYILLWTINKFNFYSIPAYLFKLWIKFSIVFVFEFVFIFITPLKVFFKINYFLIKTEAKTITII